MYSHFKIQDPAIVYPIPFMYRKYIVMIPLLDVSDTCKYTVYRIHWMLTKQIFHAKPHLITKTFVLLLEIDVRNTFLGFQVHLKPTIPLETQIEI